MSGAVGTISGIAVGGRDGVSTGADYDAFFRAEYPRVVRAVHGVLGDRARAEEVAQEAFVRLFVRWDRVSTYDLPGAWVRRVAIRLAVRVLRRDRLRAVLERRATSPRPPPVENDVVAALATLSRAQRIAVVLHYLEDRPIVEVAAMMGCAEATARVHLHRARRRLADVLPAARTTDG